ncbi:hypothetical protein AB4Z01_24310 [Inquilinus sp. YAF38]|uniref:hypothetical protein n=1 Tax=Inquilinus sp. YAF38 TaxID=3233084 RepID=UPI003F936E0B
MVNDPARDVLQVLKLIVKRGGFPWKAGVVVLPEDIVLQHLGDYSQADFDDGVEYAVKQGWLVRNNGGLELTETGVEQA